MNSATIICHHNRLLWIVKRDGDTFTGGDPISSCGGDYMVTMSNVVNRLQELHGLLEFNFIRG